MEKFIQTVLLFTILHSAHGFEAPKIIALGVSEKGQFIALEEYGYNSFKHAYYTKLRIINVWSKQDMIPVTEFKMAAQNPEDLDQIRYKLKNYASEYMTKYKIIPINQRKVALSNQVN